MFWHRLLNKHAWKTIDEYRIEGIKLEQTGFEGRGIDLEGTINCLRSGFKVIHQECTVCGDRRTLNKS